MWPHWPFSRDRRTGASAVVAGFIAESRSPTSSFLRTSPPCPVTAACPLPPSCSFRSAHRRSRSSSMTMRSGTASATGPTAAAAISRTRRRCTRARIRSRSPAMRSTRSRSRTKADHFRRRATRCCTSGCTAAPAVGNSSASSCRRTAAPRAIRARSSRRAVSAHTLPVARPPPAAGAKSRCRSPSRHCRTRAASIASTSRAMPQAPSRPCTSTT